MNLLQAIEHAEEVAKLSKCPNCAAEHIQLAMWLRELYLIKKQNHQKDVKPAELLETVAKEIEKQVADWNNYDRYECAFPLPWMNLEQENEVTEWASEMLNVAAGIAIGIMNEKLS